MSFLTRLISNARIILLPTVQGYGMQHVTQYAFPSLTPGFFLEIFGAVSDEYGKRFHQNIAQFNRRFSGK